LGTLDTDLYLRAYNDTNRTVTTTDAKGYRTVVSYDEFFRKISEEQSRPDTENEGVNYDGTGKVSVANQVWTYDPVYRDKVLTETRYANASGTNYYRTSYTYDNLGRLTAVSQGNQTGLGQVKTISYTDSTSSASDTVTEKQYRYLTDYTQVVTTKDRLDRVISVMQYAGVDGTGTTSTTSMAYNYAGQPITKTLADSEVYTYSYSRAGLLESVVYPQSRGTETHVYDYNGRLTTKTDVGGNATAYTYNTADLETNRISTNPTNSAIKPVSETTSYTQYGPKLVIQAWDGSEDIRVGYSYAYSSGALMTTETRQVAAGTSSVSHGYDVAGNLRTLSVTGFDGSFSKTFGYSLPYFGTDGSSTDRSMKVSMNNTMLGVVSTNYTGLKTTIDYGSGARTNYTSYDAFMRLQAIDHPGIVCDQTYNNSGTSGYDWQGNVTYWNGTTYTYDGMNQLWHEGSNIYTYDVIGNQTAAPGSTTYQYIASGSYNSMRLDSKTVSGVVTDYQDDGHLVNLTAVVGKYTDLAYDTTNRLISIKDVARGNVVDQYRYGPEGLRYKKTEGVLNGTANTTYYLYEGNEILYEEGYAGSTRSFCKLNIFVGGVNVGRVKKEGSTESIQYFYNDHLGSRRAVTDSTGAVQAKIDYTVWGVPTVTNYNGYDGSLDVSYTGKEKDATGLYYFNARYYDASIGRFITEDPARNGLNWFVYCNNNPISFMDPSGLDVGNAGNDGFDKNGNPDKVITFSAKETPEGVEIKILTGVGTPTNEKQAEEMDKAADTGVIGLSKVEQTTTEIKYKNGEVHTKTSTETIIGIDVPLAIIGGEVVAVNNRTTNLILRVLEKIASANLPTGPIIVSPQIPSSSDENQDKSFDTVSTIYDIIDVAIEAIKAIFGGF
jgi:RHS repeat-associated protein